MPPIAPGSHGSRAGLITGLVVFVILFVTAAISAIYFGTQWQASIAKGKADVTALTQAVKQEDLQQPNVQAVDQDASRTGQSGITLAINQRDNAAKLIDGAGADPATVAKDAQATVDDATAQLKKANVAASLTGDNLLADIKTLTGQVVALTNAQAQAQANLKAANEKTQQAIAERAAALADKDKAIAAAQAQAADATKTNTDREAGINANVDAIKKGNDDALKAAQQATTVAQNELTKVQAELKKMQGELHACQARLAKFRLDPNQSLMQEQGYITRAPGNNTVYINLGFGQEISPGLTFEVYDQLKGLPSLTPSNNGATPDLPAGKASIEVIRILPGTSECRIVHLAPGMQIVEGDPIVNLVYNTHTKFTFVVYGDFDLANSGTATPGDADVIRRLITQWGGRVSDTVNVDTDFLVLGKEPVVPPLPDNPTPNDQERHEKAQKAYNNYIQVQDVAGRLYVPLLNQNRFLYFIGYYDQAKR